MELTYFVGLDLGRDGDYSALAIAERHREDDAPATYDIRHLERWRLGTSYATIVADCVARLDQAPLAATRWEVAAARHYPNGPGGPTVVTELRWVTTPAAPLVLDRTGVGKA